MVTVLLQTFPMITELIKKILISPCMYIGGNYTIEVHSNEYPNGGYYYPLNGTGNFTECTEFMKPVFTETKDIAKCHGYPPTVADYEIDNCIPFADKFEWLLWRFMCRRCYQISLET